MAILNPALNPIAVVFASGSLTLIRGDLIHDRGAKQRIVFSSDEPITNRPYLNDHLGLTTLSITTIQRGE